MIPDFQVLIKYLKHSLNSNSLEEICTIVSNSPHCENSCGKIVSIWNALF